MESAGVPTEQIEYANKMVEIKRKVTDKLGQHLEINSKGNKMTCTKRDRQLTQKTFSKLEGDLKTLMEGTQDSEAGVSLIGTANVDTIRSVLELGQRMLCYMQDDRPELLQQTNKPTRLKLKELNQLARDKQQLQRQQQQQQQHQAEQAQHIKNQRGNERC